MMATCMFMMANCMFIARSGQSSRRQCNCPGRWAPALHSSLAAYASFCTDVGSGLPHLIAGNLGLPALPDGKGTMQMVLEMAMHV